MTRLLRILLNPGWLVALVIAAPFLPHAHHVLQVSIA